MATAKITLTDTYTIIDTSAADVLISPKGTHATLIELYIAAAAPTGSEEGHHLKQPFILPKGVGAWVRGRGDIHVSAFAIKTP